MPTKFRFRINNQAVRKIARSEEMMAVLRPRAAKIAGAANAALPDDPESLAHFGTKESVGANRARILIYSWGYAAALAEAENRTLTKAVQAGKNV